MRIGRSAAWTAWIVALSACGGSSFDGRVFRDDEARYRVGELGEGWEPLRMSQNDLAWRHPSTGAVVQVNATCDPFADVPLTSLTNHLLIGFTDRQWREQERVPFDGREALRSHVVARLDGVPRELLLYVMKKDECTYDLALIAPEGEGFEATQDGFETFVAGFSTETDDG